MSLFKTILILLLQCAFLAHVQYVSAQQTISDQIPSQQATSKQLPSQLLATFGNMSDTACIDDDFSQAVFFAIPAQYEDDFYIRVFDPDCGGLYDKSNGLWETNTMIEIFGGEGCISDVDARCGKPIGNYRSGKSLGRALFARESQLDAKWYAFGPFTAVQGERLPDYPGYVFFKVLVEGRTGNDGNVYAIQVSQQSDLMKPLQHARQFAYQTTTLLDGVVVSRTEMELGKGDNDSGLQVKLPVKLEKINTSNSLNIFAEPINE